MFVKINQILMNNLIMTVPKIQALDNLMGQYVDNDKSILDTKIIKLTLPGENYGSDIYKLDLTLKSRGNSKTEELNLVAKLLPSNEFSRLIFNVQVTFKNEKAFYDTLLPTLQEFQRKQGVQNVIDFFPKFYGARSNLKGDETGPVDDDSVIIMENLKIKGFTNVDRHVGFDLAATKLILKHLAEFHAIPLALKQNDPKTFEEKVKAYMACFHPEGSNSLSDKPFLAVTKIFEQSEKYRHFIPQFKKSMEHYGKTNTYREPYATLVHKDLWSNNIMLKFNRVLPTNCKFVDFQGYTYGSAAVDLLFFLFSSVQIEVLQNSLDELLKLYHQYFIETLRSLNSGLTFTYQNLLDEIIYAAELEFGHIVFKTLFVINAEKGGLLEEADGTPEFSKVKFSEITVKNLFWMIKEWDRRGWLNF